jgi:alanine racemase
MKRAGTGERGNEGTRSAMQRTWAEIDLGALAHNLRVTRKFLRPSCQVMAVVKADGYGHGAVEVAKAAGRAGARWLGVATLNEGLALRRAGIKTLMLVLGPTAIHDLTTASQNKISVTIGSHDFLDALLRMRRRPRVAVQLKVDTGMTRLGIVADEADRAILTLKESGIILEGCYTHLSTPDEPDRKYTEEQLARFAPIAATARRAFPKVLIHTAGSAAVMAHPMSHYDLVRIGIAMYGISPAQNLQSDFNLRPVMRLKSRVVRVARISAGTAVGYGATFRARTHTAVATVACGYADGYPRLAGENSEVIIRGMRYPIVGRVSMDYLTVDVGNTDVSVRDEVELFGERISVDEVASRAQTISYEILTGIGPRVPRIYMR